MSKTKAKVFQLDKIKSLSGPLMPAIDWQGRETLTGVTCLITAAIMRKNHDPDLLEGVGGKKIAAEKFE